MVVKAKPKTQAEKLAERRQELDYFAQVEQQRVERVATHDAEHADFLARVEQRKELERAALERGEELPPVVIPTITGIYEAKAAEEQAAEQEAERQRIASLTPRDIWLSTRSLSERNSIARWEQINRMPYPIPGLEAVEA